MSIWAKFLKCYIRCIWDNKLRHMICGRLNCKLILNFVQIFQKICNIIRRIFSDSISLRQTKSVIDAKMWMTDLVSKLRIIAQSSGVTANVMLSFLDLNVICNENFPQSCRMIVRKFPGNSSLRWWKTQLCLFFDLWLSHEIQIPRYGKEHCFAWESYRTWLHWLVQMIK